ncbi:hypothetical protein JFT91_27175 [Pseudomonas sp. TH08]|uniref:hypothetical protein n=1 Tax=Pseudomonas sp. TH08 TaxID=2796374 RepID=UPI001912CA41|nr:hypothetical protein [Pseudomonas sp. TH08]MBK5536217.1 hypothetical protein [Pseudomonas sp. TH08]
MKTLFAMTLATAMTLCTPILHATETPDAEEIAFHALSPVVSALINADFRQLFSEGNEVKSRTHEGGHFYPDDWKISFPQALRWVMREEG